MFDLVQEKMKGLVHKVKVERGAMEAKFYQTSELNECTVLGWIQSNGWGVKHFASCASQGDHGFVVVHTYMFEEKLHNENH